MKKVYLFITTIIIVVSLTSFIFASNREYDFLTVLEKVSKLNYTNPIEDFNIIINAFKNLFTGSFIANTGNFFENVGNFFVAFWDLLKSPIEFIYYVARNILLLSQALLMVLGIPFN